MNSNRKTAIIVGVLFLISYCGVFIGNAILAPILDAPDYLMNIYRNKNQVIIGVLIELINDAVVVGIAAMLFSILKKHSESIALWYVGFRVIEAVIYSISKISILSLITLSQEFIAAGAADASNFQALSVLALSGRYWAGEMAAIFFFLGALIFYYLLYQSKLLPRFISVWGLIAVASVITAKVLGVPDLTQGFQPAMISYFPIVLNELFLAIWLIVKGFKSVPINK
ncbi:MAG: DUF4386 domain-containing protein [Candidatus Hodarchaeales archaeon]|jgi:hypothetical protein